MTIETNAKTLSAQTVFIVSADHRIEQYRLNGKRFAFHHAAEANLGYIGLDLAVSEEFWADLPRFGCGKSAGTPERAIRALLNDNGCTNIRIERQDPQPEQPVEIEPETFAQKLDKAEDALRDCYIAQAQAPKLHPMQITFDRRANGQLECTENKGGMANCYKRGINADAVYQGKVYRLNIYEGRQTFRTPNVDIVVHATDRNGITRTVPEAHLTGLRNVAASVFRHVFGTEGAARRAAGETPTSQVCEDDNNGFGVIWQPAPAIEPQAQPAPAIAETRRAYIGRHVMQCAEMIVERMNSWNDEHAEREALEFIGDCLDGDFLEVMSECPTTRQDAERELLRLTERDRRTGSRHAPLYAERTEALRNPVEFKTYREFSTVPEYEQPIWADGQGGKITAKIENPDNLKWSGDLTPPAIGTVVRITMNGIGLATVTGYFCEGNWLGFTANIHDAPAWHRKQRKNDPKGHFFGLDFQPV